MRLFRAFLLGLVHLLPWYLHIGAENRDMQVMTGNTEWGLLFKIVHACFVTGRESSDSDIQCTTGTRSSDVVGMGK